MSSIRRRQRAYLKDRASVFSALGDQTRLSMIGILSNGRPQSITRLAEGSTLTRQAVTKHLRVLQDAGLVYNLRVGRESLFEFRPKPLKEIQSYLETVSDQWERALDRLKSYVEK